MSKIDKRIITYVDLFFENIPYSSTNENIKKQITKKMQMELDNLNEFEILIEKYNTLEKICELINCSSDEVKKIKSKENLVKIKKLKTNFKKKRKSAYIIGISSMISLAYLYNTWINFHLFYGIITCFLLIFVIINLTKFKKLSNEQAKYSLQAYEYLKCLHDKYTKKFINMLFLFFAFTAFFLINIYMLGINSKLTEILELVNSILFYYEIIGVLVIKNYLLANWINQNISQEECKKSKNHFRKIFFVDFTYWALYLVICLIFKNNFNNIFILFLALNGLGIIFYNFFYRKKITFVNIAINKKRIAFYSLLIVGITMYSIMQQEFWVLQPYINSIPNIGNNNNSIFYNEENGIYTIVDNNGGDFKILQLTDIHLGGSIFSYSKDIKALKAVYKLLTHTKPDFVIVTGDLTFPLGLFSLSLNNHTPVMEFASFMRNTGIPWAFTYGNHDTESIATYSKEDLNLLYKMLSFKTSKNLLYPYMQPEITGRNNQMIEIRTKNGKLKQALFLIDSNAYTEEGFNKYDYIHDDQVNWYKNHILRLEKEEGTKISSMLFFHIPLQQYKTAYQLYENGSNEVKYYFGSNDEKLFDKVCASEYPSKIFDTALELESTKAMFCGHDHYNNISLEYKGIRLTYGMSIDYLAMPGISKDTKQRGATLITLHEDNKYEIKQIPLASIK